LNWDIYNCVSCMCEKGGVSVASSGFLASQYEGLHISDTVVSERWILQCCHSVNRKSLFVTNKVSTRYISLRLYVHARTVSTSTERSLSVLAKA